MKKIFYTIIIIAIPKIIWAQDTSNLYRIKYYNQKISKYLDKEKSLSGHYLIDKDGIKIFASAQDKMNKKVEFEMTFSQVNPYIRYIQDFSSNASFSLYSKGKLFIPADAVYHLPPNPNSNKKLLGYKIAIDPGHIASDFETGDLEKKHLKFKIGIYDSIEIAEGILTYATAILLKQKLEEEGAEVFVTRKNGESAFGKSFVQWKKEDLKNAVDSLYKIGEIKLYQKQYFLSEKAEDRDIFRVIFRDLDLAKRAEMINKFKPNFTIVIHYNVDEKNLEWEKPTTKNYNMIFIGGAFMKNDLSSPEKRFEFLRLLITDDIEKSIQLSASTVNQFEKILNVKTATTTDAKYLNEGCIATEKKGVFCRNLQLTRYIHSPLVYGETLYQDNIDECKLLNLESDKTKNKRVQQVAEAYYQGILNYVSSQEK